MKPAPFELFSPETEEEISELLAEHGDEARLLAGGQSLVPLMNMRVMQPAVVVNLGRCRSLARLDEANGGLVCGAMCRQADALDSEPVGRLAPLLAQGLAHVGVPASRHRGTVCGSLAHADPSAELPAVAAALDARFVIAGARGEREVGPGEFFDSALTTCLDPDEWLRAVRVPAATPGGYHAFQEVSNRAHGSALAGLAASVRLDGDGCCTAVRLAAAGMGVTGLRLAAAEAALAGRRPDAAAARDAAAAASAEAEPDDDLHADAGYRRHLIGVLVKRTVEALAARAGEDDA